MRACVLTVIVVLASLHSVAAGERNTGALPAGSCGDGDVDLAEECDDGGSADGDGCSSLCRIECGYTCDGEPSICSNPANVPSFSPAGMAALVLGLAGLSALWLTRARARRR